MQIVIDIDEDTYKDIKRGKIYTSVRDVPQESVLAIANGTPLQTDAVDRVTIKEYLESFGKDTSISATDCISRSAVLAIAGDSCLDLDSYEDTREFCDEINELPPVTPPHPKVGHWISLDTGKPSHLKDGMTTEGVKCSECGEWLIASDEYACSGRYCPNCGSYNGGSEE